MEDLDTRVLRTCARLLNEGRSAILVMVARTWGSSPRPPGALMVLGPDGLTVGSVSGGCIDEDTAHRYGLPCGGTIELVLEPLGARSRIPALMDALHAREVVQRDLDLRTGEVTLQAAPHSDAEPSLSETRFSLVLGPRYRLLVIGAGDLSQYLCATALGLGFDITVCDPRMEHRQGWTLSGVSLVSEMPDDVVQAMRPDERTAVIALTHDPRLDDLALMDALKTRAFYVGAIGSRLHHPSPPERLPEQFDLSKVEVERLRSPAGLYI